MTSESSSATKARRSRRETREPAHRDAVAPSPPSHSIKAETPDFLSLQYTDHTSPSYWEGSTPSDDCSVEEPWQFHGGLLRDTTGQSLVGQQQPSIAAPHPVRHSDCNQLVAPLPAHGNAQAHTQIRLPMLFDMPPQHLAEHEVYMHPEVKYEPSTALGLHSYDP